jgi:hypothetical protein
LRIYDLKRVLKYFGLADSNFMNFEEFLQMILPCDNPVLRCIVTQQ